MTGFIDRRLEIGWDRQLNTDLPDCRSINREKHQVIRARMRWDKVYCASCGKLEGLVTADWTPHVFAICNACVDKMGEPGAPKVSPEDEKRMRNGEAA